MLCIAPCQGPICLSVLWSAPRIADRVIGPQNSLYIFQYFAQAKSRPDGSLHPQGFEDIG